MNVMKCSVCKKPILGYWVTIKKMGDNRNICVPCAQTTTIWDLVVEGVFGIYPDIAVEVEADKQVLSSAYGMVAESKDTDSAPDAKSDADYKDTDSAIDVKSSYPAVFAKVKEDLKLENSIRLDPDKNLPENVEFMESEDES